MHVVTTYTLNVRSPTRVSYISNGGVEKVQIVSDNYENEFNFIFLDDIDDWTQICKENSLIFKGQSLIFYDRYSTLDTKTKLDIYNEMNMLLKDDVVYFFRHKEEKNVFMLVNQSNVKRILGE